MDKDVAAALEAVPLRIENPELIPAKRYYDQQFFELEKEKLWPHVWQMACRLEEIPEVGDYVEYRIFEKTVIVVRSKNGVKAFHNVCRHRGMKLITGAGNCKNQGFVCPFHGWRYNLDGENTFVFGRKIFSEEVLEQTEINLKPCRLETWGGCAFINFDDDAPSLLDSLGPITAKLDARNADKLRTEWWYASELPTNWKVAVEAFVEMYHLMRTHPELHGLTPPAFGAMYGEGSTAAKHRDLDARGTVNLAIDYMANVGEGMGGLVRTSELALMERLRDMDLPEDPGEAMGAFFTRARNDIVAESKARGVPIYDLNTVAVEHPSQANEFMFPNFFLLPMMGATASYRIRPLTAETCLFEIWSLILVPEDEPYDSPKGPTVLPHDSPDYPLIVRQDYENMPKQQEGLRSGAIEYQRLSREHEGEISNFQRLIDGYLAGLDGKMLAKAAHVVNGGSFSAVRDLGF